MGETIPNADVPSRSPAINARKAAACLAATLLAGCINPVGSALFQPRPLASQRPAWVDRAPIAVSARTADRLDLAGSLGRTGRLYLFGDGLGAAVALKIASRPDVSGTVTLGAFDRFGSFAPSFARHAYADAFDKVAAIRQVKTPVVIMHGRKDQVVPFSAAEGFAARPAERL